MARAAKKGAKPTKRAAPKRAAPKGPAKGSVAKRTVTKVVAAAKAIRKKTPTPAAKPAAKKTAPRVAAAKKKSTKATPAKATPAKATPAKARSTTAGSTKAGSTKAGSTKDRAQKSQPRGAGSPALPSEPAKPEPAKPEAAKPEAAKPEAAKPAPPKKPRKPEVTPKTIEKIKGSLEAQRVALLREFTDLEEGAFSLSQSDMSGEASFDEEYADAGSFTFEREKELSIGNNIRDLLEKVTHALDRIERGTYGLCENCGDPINKDRLMALPYSSLCIRCKQQEERTR